MVKMDKRSEHVKNYKDNGYTLNILLWSMSTSFDYFNIGDSYTVAVTTDSKFTPHVCKFVEATSSLHFITKIIISFADSQFSHVVFLLEQNKIETRENVCANMSGCLSVCMCVCEWDKEKEID
jgi:hypothetical protein